MTDKVRPYWVVSALLHVIRWIVIARPERPWQSLSFERWRLLRFTRNDNHHWSSNKALVYSNWPFFTVMLSRKAKHLAWAAENNVSLRARFFATLRYAQTCPWAKRRNDKVLYVIANKRIMTTVVIESVSLSKEINSCEISSLDGDRKLTIDNWILTIEKKSRS